MFKALPLAAFLALAAAPAFAADTGSNTSCDALLAQHNADGFTLTEQNLSNLINILDAYIAQGCDQVPFITSVADELGDTYTRLAQNFGLPDDHSLEQFYCAFASGIRDYGEARKTMNTEQPALGDMIIAYGNKLLSFDACTASR